MVKTPEQLARTAYFHNLSTTNDGIKAARILAAHDLVTPPGHKKTEKDVWRDVGEHHLAQEAAVVSLGWMLGLPDDEIGILRTAAKIHDIHKKDEAPAQKALGERLKAQPDLDPTEIGRQQQEVTEKFASQGQDYLRAAGYSPLTRRIVSADGHMALQRIMAGEASWLEKIFHYAGDVVSGSSIIPNIDHRINPMMTDTKYQARELYSRTLPWTDGKSYYEIQKEVGHQLETEIIQHLIAADRLPQEVLTRLEKDPQDLPAIIRLVYLAQVHYHANGH